MPETTVAIIALVLGSLTAGFLGGVFYMWVWIVYNCVPPRAEGEGEDWIV